MSTSQQTQLRNITLHEFERLQSIERAWKAVFEQLNAGNPCCFRGGQHTGMECAVIEIKRLQEKQ